MATFACGGEVRRERGGGNLFLHGGKMLLSVQIFKNKDLGAASGPPGLVKALYLYLGLMAARHEAGKGRYGNHGHHRAAGGGAPGGEKPQQALCGENAQKFFPNSGLGRVKASSRGEICRGRRAMLCCYPGLGESEKKVEKSEKKIEKLRKRQQMRTSSPHTHTQKVMNKKRKKREKAWKNTESWRTPKAPGLGWAGRSPPAQALELPPSI